MVITLRQTRKKEFKLWKNNSLVWTLLDDTDSQSHNDLIIDQFIKQAIPFTQNAYLKELQRKFRKLLLFIDRAVCSSIMIRKHLEENKDVIRVEYLPKGSPDYNAVEECWREGKDESFGMKILFSFVDSRTMIRFRRFSLGFPVLLQIHTPY